MRLTTPRLVLRDRNPADDAAVLALVSDYEVVKFTARWPWPADADLVRERGAQVVAPERGFLAAIERDGRLIGIASIVDGALGYMFERAAWGQGYATEAARALVDHAFTTLPALQTITAGLYDGNEASARVLERIGFRQTGRGTLFCMAQQRDLDGPDYALSRAEWAATRPPAVKAD